jgi:hypothetical protein
MNSPKVRCHGPMPIPPPIRAPGWKHAKMWDQSRALFEPLGEFARRPTFGVLHRLPAKRAAARVA